MLAATDATTTSQRRSASPLRSEAAAFGPELSRHYGGASSYSANGLPMGWSESADSGGVFSEMFRLARMVYHGTACDLPGVSVDYNKFIPDMWKAVQAGFVRPAHAEFVQQGLRWGTEAGLNPSLLRGVRVFSNYESATGDWGRPRVTEATEARVAAGRTPLIWGHGQGASRPCWAVCLGVHFAFPLDVPQRAWSQTRGGLPTTIHAQA